MLFLRKFESLLEISQLARNEGFVGVRSKEEVCIARSLLSQEGIILENTWNTCHPAFFGFDEMEKIDSF